MAVLPGAGARVVRVGALAAAELRAVDDPPSVQLAGRDRLVEHLVEHDRGDVEVRDLLAVEGRVDPDDAGVLHVDAGLHGALPPAGADRPPPDARLDRPPEVLGVEPVEDALEVVDATARLDPGGPRLDRLQPRGRIHDLQEIFERLNAEHFGGAIEARIGWGPVRLGRRRRTVKTGVYVQDARLIRIHPTLDRPEVPAYYVAAVVFHEMLHQAVPAREVNGRRVVHGADFRARERAYPDHARARAWEERNLALLLSSPA